MQDTWLVALDLYQAYKSSYEKLVKTGDRDRFYSFCYNNIILHPDTFLPGYNTHGATMLLCKITDRLIMFSKQTQQTQEEEIDISKLNLSQKEKHGLKYIGGYVSKSFTKN